LYFEGRSDANENASVQDSILGEWEEIDIISLDKCIGRTNNSSNITATLNQWAETILGLTNTTDRDKAFLINENGWSILMYNKVTNIWENRGSQFNQNTDAIYDVDNRTHYADFKSVQSLAQLRFTVQSVMNVTRQIPSEPRVAMPEMQLFGLPTETINASAVATITALKAEDTEGNLHNILGRHQRLPLRSPSEYQHFVRLHVGEVANIKSDDKRLYFDIYTVGVDYPTQPYISLDDTANPYHEVSINYTYTEQPTYYELYIYSVNGEKIILSSGYIGGDES